jgi:hypothetical protein
MTIPAFVQATFKLAASEILDSPQLEHFMATSEQDSNLMQL